MGCDNRNAPALFQTPNQQGALRAAWTADGSTIVTKPASTADPCSCAASYDQDVYVWDANANRPTSLFSLGEPTSLAEIGLSSETGDGKVLAWRGYDVADAGRDRKAFIWDLATQQLESVLPTPGYLTQAAISPQGDRAVTVSYSGQWDPLGEDARTWETLLWDTTHRSLAKTAAAQTSYWDALNAAWEGKPHSALQRSLRRAKSLGPELFSSVTEISQDDAAAYGAALACGPRKRAGRRSRLRGRVI